MTAGDRFPVVAPHDRPWLLSRRGSWSAGCWTGLLWLRARVRGTDEARDDAVACAARLRNRIDEDTSTRAMIFWLGAAGVEPLGAGEEVQELAALAARRVAASFDPALGVFPDGSALGRGAAGRIRCTVDPGFALVRLLNWSESRCRRLRQAPTGLAQLGLRHLRVLFGGVLSDGRAHTAFAAVDGSTVVPVGTPGCWARGQAWALLAAAAAGQVDGPCWAPVARALAGHWAALPIPPPDRLPPGAQPGGHVDTGASAIAAYALLTLSGWDTARADAHRAAAQTQVGKLVTGHLGGSWPGLVGSLRDGCYTTAPGTREPVESVWGSFFLLASLLTLEGILPVGMF